MSDIVVIPCFNEARRLPVSSLDVLRSAGVTPLVVDDGSTDTTAAIVEAAGHRVLRQPRQGGKAEAVRAGLLSAIADGAMVVGYLDADFSTPAAEYLRLRDTLVATPAVEVVLGARVAHLGARIDRRPIRHYLGRVFATAASLRLGLPIYDTQCGAKVFRVTPALTRALASPFVAGWAFDVELLHRLLEAGVAPTTLCEVPLREWHDIAGSHLTVRAMVGAGVDLIRLPRRR